MTNVYTIDGSKIVSLETFYDQIEADLIPGCRWGRNLDAFDDVLSGGFGTPDDGFTIRWLQSNRSRQLLGYDETIRVLEARLKSCHPSAQNMVQRQLDEARRCEGHTVFDWILDILKDHGPGGSQAEDNVQLALE